MNFLIVCYQIKRKIAHSAIAQHKGIINNSCCHSCLTSKTERSINQENTLDKMKRAQIDIENYIYLKDL